MKRSLRFLLVLLVFFCLSLGAGCAAKKKTVYSGFMGDYPIFKKGPEEGADLVYIKEGVDFSKYNRVMMDHVVFWFKKDAEYKGVQTDEMAELSETFHKAMIEALQDAYPFVDEPGPDVLRLRLAITDVVPSKPGINTVTTIMPVGLVISTVKKGASGKYPNVGEASMEAEIFDSLTNKRIAAAIDTKAGGKLEGLTKWGAVESAFRFWAGRLRTFLDEQHGRKEPPRE